jgi:hypothetical protein
MSRTKNQDLQRQQTPKPEAQAPEAVPPTKQNTSYVGMVNRKFPSFFDIMTS